MRAAIPPHTRVSPINTYLVRLITPGVLYTYGNEPEEIDAITQALVARQKTNVVIETPEEARLVVRLLREHINGIAHPRNGCTWATPAGRRAVERRIEQIEEAADL